MCKFESKGEMGAPCGVPFLLYLFCVVRCFLPRFSVLSTAIEVNLPNQGEVTADEAGNIIIGGLSWRSFLAEHNGFLVTH